MRYLPLCYSDCSGSGPCVTETAKPKEQNGEQIGEHWPEEDTHGTPVRSPRTGAGGWIVDQRLSERCAGMGGGCLHLN